LWLVFVERSGSNRAVTRLSRRCLWKADYSLTAQEVRK